MTDVINPAAPSAVSPVVTPPPVAAPAEQEAAPPVSAEDPRLAARFVQLTKREKAIQEQQKAFKEKEQQWMQYEQAKAKAKENPLEFLTQHGLSYDELTNFILSGGPKPSDPKLTALEQKLAEIEQQTLKEKEAQQLAQTQAEEAYINKVRQDYINEAYQVAISSPDQYELVIQENAYSVVLDVAEQIFLRDGVVPESKEVLQLVEDYLFDEAKKYTKVKKFNNLYQSVSEPEPKNTPQPQVQAKRVAPPTLTNKLSNVNTTTINVADTRDELLANLAKKYSIVK